MSACIVCKKPFGSEVFLIPELCLSCGDSLQKTDKITLIRRIVAAEDLLDECGRLFPWLKGWADVWHRDAGGYTASDTLVGLVKCDTLLAKLAKRGKE